MTVSTAPERRPVAHLPAPSGGHDAAALTAVRRFHLAGEPGELPALPEGAVPAVLADVAKAPVPPTGYPVLVDADGGVHALEDALRAAAGAGPAVLVDNLPRLAQQVRARFAELDERVAAPAVAEAADGLVAQLQLQAGPKGELVKALEAMIRALPEGAKLLGLAPDVDLRLLWRTTCPALGARREALMARWAPLARGLSQRLEVDRHKRDGHSAQAVRAAGAGGAQFFNAGALAQAIGQHRGTASLGDAEREALSAALAALEAPLDAPRLVLVHGGDCEAPWLAQTDNAQVLAAADPFAAAAAAWAEHAAAFAKRYRAARYAALVLEDRYEADKHGPWLDAFDHQAFDADERAALPAVVVVTTDKAIAHEGLAPASAALRGHAPVRVLCRVTPTVDCDGPTLDHSHLELGYLGMSHRQALVQQTTVGRAEHLQAALARADAAARPSLTLVGVAHTIDGSPPPLGAWLHASASVEGRAHPLFVYDPGAGERWARRLTFEGNPDLQADWPAMAVAVGDSVEEWAFTFADQAVMERAYAEHLRVVPEACAAHEDLVPVAAWLAADDQDRAHQVPTVWVADRKGGLLRAAVSRPLALAAQDRLDFWHTLQELAGVHNAHVEAAVAATRAELQAAHAAELEALQVAHAAEVARVERETAHEALSNLAAALTGGAAFELSASAPAVAPVPDASPAAVAETVPAEAAEAEVTAAPEPEPEPPADPWVDSVLCTSCNDCINLNGQLFAYNGNKQAVIADPEAGTFAELVRAAEACPSKCIHPGAPLNPNEPNLDDLVARAAKFN